MIVDRWNISKIKEFFKVYPMFTLENKKEL
jgi:hypothetical protein